MEVSLFGCSDAAFEDIKRIRYAVFTGEQGIAVSDDLDAYDASPDTVYALVCDGLPCAAGRMIITEHGYKIGRVATLSDYRGRGYGAAVVNTLCERAFSLGAAAVTLEAQLHAIPFYQSLGFTIVSDERIFDRGIEHRMMRKTYG